MLNMQMALRPFYMIMGALGLFSLCACQTIEHRSEAIPKSVLPEISPEVSANLLWRTSNGGTAKTDVALRIASSEDILVVADAKGHVFAINKQRGTQVWAANLKTEITAGPSLVDNVVFVGLQDAKLAALDAKDGNVLWQVSVTSEILAPPQAYQGIAYVHTLDGGITALSTNDGRQLWRYSLNAPSLLLRRGSMPQIVGEEVLTGFANGRVVALNRLDGSVVWEKEIATAKGQSDIARMVDISADPVIDKKVAFLVGYRGPLVALSAENGEQLWQKNITSIAGLTVVDDRLYLSDVTGTVWALDSHNGDLLWKQEALKGRHLSKPSLQGKYLVVGDDEGNVHWLALQDGHLSGRLKVDSKGIATPIVVNHNQIFVLGRSGNFNAYTLRE